MRHALPGERVVVEITEGTDGDRFWRGDAVEVLEPSPDRVDAALPVRRPGPLRRLRLPARDAGAAAVAQGGRGPRAALPAGRPRARRDRRAGARRRPDGLRWRTRQRYVELPGGRRGMRKHRSHDVVEVDDCLIAGAAGRPRRARHRFEVDDDGFWQVHPGAPEVLVDTVLAFLAPRPGESVLDLYAGVGLFARFLADAVGAVRRDAGRGRPRRVRARRGQRARRHGAPRVTSARCSTGSRRRRSTWSSSTRRARAPAVPSSRRSPPGARARSPTSPATRPPWPATWRSSPSTATGWHAAARSLRPASP